MPAIAHKSDPISHGGLIISGSDNVYAENKPVARVGDLVRCRRHGVKLIISGADSVRTNGKVTGMNGSICSCGALVLSSGSVYVEENV
jgi:uncharacterized Zn-binding protein involved in type VI secretion